MRQQIEVAIEFYTPKSYKSLPSSFWGTRRWFRDGGTALPDITWDREIEKNYKLKRLANRFLNSIEYTYIPAIKDGDTFQHVMNKLKISLPLKETSLNIKEFNSELSKYGKELKDDLNKNIGLLPLISLPSTIKELLSSLDFSIEDKYVTSSLSCRGDGIRCRFIPAILNYITLSSNKKHIWGLEEPENSLEYSKAYELNDTIEKEYSKNAQIFITSHSPAFTGDLNQNSPKNIFLISKNDSKIKVDKIDKKNFETYNLKIGSELGYIQIQKELSIALTTAIQKNKQQEQIFNELSQKINKNIVFVEGESDINIIKTAWQKLRPNKNINFSFQVCGGYNTLHATLNNHECCSKSKGHVWIGLFDFDSAFDCWNGLSQNWTDLESDITKGLCKKYNGCDKYAMLIPVPSFRDSYARKEWGGASKLTIELLFEDALISRYLVTEDDPAQKKIFKKKQKISFSKTVKNFSKEEFKNFEVLINSLEKIFR
jgi:hypothetical protein